MPVDIIHLKIADHKLWGHMPELIATIAQARANGQQVEANVYPYRAGQNNLSSHHSAMGARRRDAGDDRAAEGPGAADAPAGRDRQRHQGHELVQPLHRDRIVGGHAAGLASRIPSTSGSRASA